MARSFDRRGGYPGGGKPVSPPANISSASICADLFRAAANIKKEDDLSLDCSCENNDPQCAECWKKLVYTSSDTKPAYVADIAAGVILSDFDVDVRYRFDECLELLLRKHKDYGPSGIGNAPGGALNGLRVRMHDKLARINHLIDTGVEPSNESLRDSFADLCNYSIISLLFLDGRWPTE